MAFWIELDYSTRDYSLRYFFQPMCNGRAFNLSNTVQHRREMTMKLLKDARALLPLVAVTLLGCPTGSMNPDANVIATWSIRTCVAGAGCLQYLDFVFFDDGTYEFVNLRNRIQSGTWVQRPDGLYVMEVGDNLFPATWEFRVSSGLSLEDGEFLSGTACTVFGCESIDGFVPVSAV